MRFRDAAAVSIVAAPLLLIIAAPFLVRQRALGRVMKEPARLAAAVVKAVPAAERAWPGYRPLDQPVLFAYMDAHSLLIGAPRAPEGFSTSFRLPASALFGRRHFFPPFKFSMSFDLDGSTVTALRASYFQDPALQAGLFIHERFHHFQNDVFRRSGAKPYLVEDPLDVALACAENDGLAAWVETGDPEGVRDFAAARLRRRKLFPQSDAELEDERIEGTARFVESTAVEVSSGPAAARRWIADELRASSVLLAMGKARSYSVGGALCRWLDAEGVPSWRAAIAGGRAPSELVLERLALGEDEAARRVERLLTSPRCVAALMRARREIAALREYRAEELKEFALIPGRRLVLVSSATLASYSFDGPWVHFRDGSSMLNMSEWVVDRPEIRVRLGGGKTVFSRPGRAEFVVPPNSLVVLDGAPWTFKPGRRAFTTLSISSAPRVELSAGPGTLDDDGKYVRLSFGPK